MKTSIWAKLETRPFLFIRSIVNLIFAYLFVSLSIDTGRLLYYAFTIAFLAFALRNLIKALEHPKHGKR